MKKRLICFFILQAVALLANFADAGNPSARFIQRTMKDLEDSTFENPAHLRILFYGQSIVEQGWHSHVVAALSKCYPSARLEVANRAIGGFTSQHLARTAKSDLYPYYPDMLFFHVYGPLDKYEEIVRRTRELTTAEIVLWTSHIDRTEGASRDSVEKLLKNPDERSRGIRRIAERYGCLFVDLRKKWCKAILESGLSVTNVLKDGIHLRDDGPGMELYARFLSEELVRIPGEKGVSEFSGKVKKVPFWDKTVRHFPDGRVELPFVGNRVVAVADGRGGCAVRVTLDGRDPRDFPGMYYNSRPSRIASPWMPAINHVDSLPGARMVEQDWRYVFLEGTEPLTPIHFRIEGSVTGFEGEGWSTNEFRSASGRVIIPADQPSRWQYEYFAKDKPERQAKPGQVLRWSTRPLFEDPYVPQAAGVRTTLVQNCPNGKHTLSLSTGSGSAGIAWFLVYEPAGDRSTSRCCNLGGE